MSNKGIKLEETNADHRTRSKARKHPIRQAKKDIQVEYNFMRFSAKTFLVKDKK